MMTSRSEYRLLLRQDNADERLTPIGYRVGLIGEERYQKFLEKQETVRAEKERLSKTTVAPSERVNAFLREHGSTEITTGIKLSELLRRPELSYSALAEIDAERPNLSHGVALSVEIGVKYEGYIRRELAEVERQRRLEEKRLPDGIDYFKVTGIRSEAAEKLDKIRPTSLGQASRISGVSPADISVLLIYLSARK